MQKILIVAVLSLIYVGVGDLAVAKQEARGAHPHEDCKPECYVESQCLISYSECRISDGSYYTTGPSVHAKSIMKYKYNRVCVACNGTVARFSTQELDNMNARDVLYADSEHPRNRTRSEAEEMALFLCREYIASIKESVGMCR